MDHRIIFFAFLFIGLAFFLIYQPIHQVDVVNRSSWSYAWSPCRVFFRLALSLRLVERKAFPFEGGQWGPRGLICRQHRFGLVILFLLRVRWLRMQGVNLLPLLGLFLLLAGSLVPTAIGAYVCSHYVIGKLSKLINKIITKKWE